MYHKYLPIFIMTANCGSFSKASEKLYISPNAIIKQINHLEAELGIVLFYRSHRGLTLTEEGKFIYEKAQYIIQYSQDTLKQAKELRDHRTKDITIGISPLRHFTPYIQTIKQFKAIYQDFNINIVSFDDKRKNFDHLLNHLGDDIDCFFGIYPSSHFQHRANVLPIRTYPLCISASVNHPLAYKDTLSLDDLNGHKLIMVNRGDTQHIDNLRDEIEQHYPAIEIINVPAYDIDTFNLCDQLNGLMISVSLWENIHPLLVNIPLQTPYHVPYGLIYPLSLDEKMTRFIQDFQMILTNSSHEAHFSHKTQASDS